MRGQTAHSNRVWAVNYLFIGCVECRRLWLWSPRRRDQPEVINIKTPDQLPVELTEPNPTSRVPVGPSDVGQPL